MLNHNHFLIQIFKQNFKDVFKTLIIVYSIILFCLFIDDYGNIFFQYTASILSMGFYFLVALAGFFLFSFTFVYLFLNNPDISIMSFKKSKSQMNALKLKFNRNQKLGLAIYALYAFSVAELATMNYIKDEISSAIFLSQYYDIATGICFFMSLFLFILVIFNIIKSKDIKNNKN